MTVRNLRIPVLSYFYIALVLHGLQRMAGLFIIELSKTKSMTYQDAAIPFIYSWAVAKIVASLSGFLIDKKSSELVVFCAVLLCAMGAALSILDTDISSITVFWGFIFGSGHGLASPHLKSSLANRSSNKLLFFMEIPSSLGISILPFLFDVLILQYGLQGSYIILSGIMLQYIPLALASVYNIEIRIPNIKWRVRKKNCQYSVSKQEEKAISNESFINSLEPDFVSNINRYDECSSKTNENCPATFSNDIFPGARKRSRTKTNELQHPEIDRKIVHKQIKTLHQIIPEEENCEKVRNTFEECFSNTNSIDVGNECQRLKNLNVINSKVTHNTSISDAILKPSNCTSDFQNKVLEEVSQDKIRETECEKTELKDQCFRNNTLNDLKILPHSCIESPSLLIIDTGTKDKNHSVSASPNTEQGLVFSTKQAKNTSLLSHKCYSEKLLDKKPSHLSLQPVFSTSTSIIPLDIKVHVEEYTFTVDKEFRSQSFDSSCSEDISYEINNSQSRSFEENECCNSVSQNVFANTLKDVGHKSNLSHTYSVSKNPKTDNKTISERKNNKTIALNIRKDELKFNFIKTLNFLNKILSPVCMCIVATRIIYDTSLIILLTNIGDVQNSDDEAGSDFKWILVAFGIGGLFGKLCCCKLSRTITGKFHTVGVVLFLLSGLSIAGVLYSPNLSWLASFYSILGALEGGISYILPKFVIDYTHKEVHHMLSTMETFLSGVAILSLPSLISLLPDEMGNYEFLLQTLSCLSVLCAFLAYFLPYLENISDKRTSKCFKEMNV